LTEDAQTILKADKIILPGVGAFTDGMQGLQERELVPVIREAAVRGIPILGICLGMQLLFESSEEKGLHAGLGLIPGKVVLFTRRRSRCRRLAGIRWRSSSPPV
jgi:glutamine amidotransferase